MIEFRHSDTRYVGWYNRMNSQKLFHHEQLAAAVWCMIRLIEGIIPYKWSMAMRDSPLYSHAERQISLALGSRAQTSIPRMNIEHKCLLCCC